MEFVVLSMSGVFGVVVPSLELYYAELVQRVRLQAVWEWKEPWDWSSWCWVTQKVLRFGKCKMHNKRKILETEIFLDYQ